MSGELLESLRATAQKVQTAELRAKKKAETQQQRQQRERAAEFITQNAPLLIDKATKSVNEAAKKGEFRADVIETAAIEDSEGLRSALEIAEEHFKTEGLGARFIVGTDSKLSYDNDSYPRETQAYQAVGTLILSWNPYTEE
jgi:hypothetical protein